MEVTTQLNDLNLVYTGTMQFQVGDVVKLAFAGRELYISMKLEEKKEEGIIEYYIEEDILKIDFINYKSSKGSGIFHPWQIGVVEGREFFMTAYIRYLGSNGEAYYFCSFNLYQGKEVLDVE